MQDMDNYKQLLDEIKLKAIELGFSQVGVADIHLFEYEQRLKKWLAAGYHGEMHYMQRHGDKRSRPVELIEGTLRVLTFAMPYLPEKTQFVNALKNPYRAYISRYALGRDYHKVLKKNLELVAQFILEKKHNLNYRVFVDSAPVLEKALAEKSGIGWIGKHSNVLNKENSSWFFLGEIYTNLPLPITSSVENHCGTCRACVDICPTQAIVADKVVDARRCISYLTIELKDSIPEELRKLIGNRVYGCDDCQIVCPWNKFVKLTDQADFKPRHDLDKADLLTLFNWSEEEFLKKTEGSAIRRIGYDQWLRNIAVALGNAPFDQSILQALMIRQATVSEMVREHIQWAIKQQQNKLLYQFLRKA